MFSLLTNDTKALEEAESTHSSSVKGGPSFVPINSNLIAPLSSKPVYMSGAETRRQAARDRIEVNFYYD